MKLLILTAFSIGLVGCAGIDRLLDVGARGVHSYCSATTLEERMIARARFQQRVYPHTAQVDCWDRLPPDERPQ